LTYEFDLFKVKLNHCAKYYVKGHFVRKLSFTQQTDCITRTTKWSIKL